MEKKNSTHYKSVHTGDFCRLLTPLNTRAT